MCSPCPTLRSSWLCPRERYQRSAGAVLSGHCQGAAARRPTRAPRLSVGIVPTMPCGRPSQRCRADPGSRFAGPSGVCGRGPLRSSAEGVRFCRESNGRLILQGIATFGSALSRPKTLRVCSPEQLMSPLHHRDAVATRRRPSPKPTSGDPRPGRLAPPRALGRIRVAASNARQPRWELGKRARLSP